MGLMAQELDDVLPNLVKNFTEPAVIDSAGNVVEDGVEYKSINYVELVPLLIAGIKEQQGNIDSLTQEIDTLNQQVSDIYNQLNNLDSLINICCLLKFEAPATSNVTDVTLQNITTIILEQNVPNPFADETDINYNLPDDVQKAEMFFYDQKGRVLQQVEITHRGEGTIHVYGQDLKSGIYTYTLLIDGKVYETKKMVKTN